MELRGKQKRFLRAMGVTMDPVLTVGKDGISNNTVVTTREVLRARELIKGRVLNTAPESPQETAEALAEATQSELVQVVGRIFLLYKRNEEEPRIELPS